MKAEGWVVDSGVTMHMTWDKGVYVMYVAMDDMPSVRLGDGRTVKAEGRGSVRLRVKDNQEAERVIRLSSVLFVLDLSYNLFSVRSIKVKGNRMLFDDVTCSIISKVAWIYMYTCVNAIYLNKYAIMYYMHLYAIIAFVCTGPYIPTTCHSTYLYIYVPVDSPR